METRLKKRLLNQCSICYQKIVLQGSIDSCKHKFCFKCILNWSKIKNTCPMCKQQFKTIKKVLNRFNDRQRFYKKPKNKDEIINVKKQEPLIFNIQLNSEELNIYDNYLLLTPPFQYSNILSPNSFNYLNSVQFMQRLIIFHNYLMQTQNIETQSQYSHQNSQISQFIQDENQNFNFPQQVENLDQNQ